MAKIRIKKIPSAVPTQAPWYNNDSSAMQKPSTSTTRQLKAVPRDEANIEAERGETALIPNKAGLPAHYNIGGNRHTGGGTPLNVPKDTFIFSDTKKMRIKDPEILAEFGKAKGSYTPAELAKKYDINKFRKILQDPDSDKLDVETAEKMIANYNLKLGKLALVQESKKGFPQGIPAVAMPYLSTFNIEPDSILPLKAEESMSQQGPPQGMPMGKYGGILSKYQLAGQWPNYNDPSYMQPPGTAVDPSYVDVTTQPDWNNMQGPPTSAYDTNPGQGTTMNLLGAPDAYKDRYNTMPSAAIAPPATPKVEGQINQSTQQMNLPDKPSMYSKSTAKTGLKMYGEDAANWDIAGMGLLTNIFSQDEKRNAEEQLKKRFKAENIYASRQDKDRGDYTTNYGYFRPDQQNVGNMVTGKYGGILQKGGNSTMNLSNDQVIEAASTGNIPSNATPVDIKRIQSIIDLQHKQRQQEGTRVSLKSPREIPGVEASIQKAQDLAHTGYDQLRDFKNSVLVPGYENLKGSVKDAYTSAKDAYNEGKKIREDNAEIEKENEKWMKKFAPPGFKTYDDLDEFNAAYPEVYTVYNDALQSGDPKKMQEAANLIEESQTSLTPWYSLDVNPYSDADKFSDLASILNEKANTIKVGSEKSAFYNTQKQGIKQEANVIDELRKKASELPSDDYIGKLTIAKQIEDILGQARYAEPIVGGLKTFGQLSAYPFHSAWTSLFPETYVSPDLPYEKYDPAYINKLTALQEAYNTPKTTKVQISKVPAVAGAAPVKAPTTNTAPIVNTYDSWDKIKDLSEEQQNAILDSIAGKDLELFDKIAAQATK